MMEAQPVTIPFFSKKKGGKLEARDLLTPSYEVSFINVQRLRQKLERGREHYHGHLEGPELDSGVTLKKRDLKKKKRLKKKSEINLCPKILFQGFILNK